VVDHQPDDHPDDRWHDSASTYVDVVVPAADSTEGSELLIITSRGFGELEDWTFIGEPDRRQQSLQLSRESAQRLAIALLEHLRQLDADPGFRMPISETDKSVDL